MANLIALKFHSGIHKVTDKAKNITAGHQSYPDFNQVSLDIRQGMDWCNYIDTYGIGMQYDKTCGHKESSADSPFGCQCCVIAVPEDFANEALKLFPDELTRLTPAEFEDFYDNKAHAHESDVDVDQKVLDTIKTKEELGLPVPEKVKAVDPNDHTPGIRENKNKRWATKKECCGHDII